MTHFADALKPRIRLISLILVIILIAPVVTACGISQTEDDRAISERNALQTELTNTKESLQD